MQRINVLEELTNESGYQVALFTTFSVNLVFFEKMITRHLIDKKCTYIGLLVDQNLLNEAITIPNITELGRTYIIKGMESYQAFHPKVYLLLGEGKAKVIIGSGNITPAGLITSYEIFNKFTYDESTGDLDNLPEIQAAYNMFLSLHHKQDNKMWHALYNKTKEFDYLKKNIQRSSKLLHNLKQPLQDQLNQELPENIYKIDCFVPFFDQNLSVIKKWNELYQPHSINIYLQEKNSNFPREIECEKNIFLFEATFLKDSYKRYHGKVFRFIGEGKEVIVYGSGNCSRQAFLYAYQHGGNAESIILEEGNIGDFDNFFAENISLSSLSNPLPEEFETMVEAEESNSQKNKNEINFIDGIVEDKKLSVTIKTRIKIDKLLIGAKSGTFSHRLDDYSTYYFDQDNEQINSIFQLIACKEEKEISFAGWCHNYIKLESTFYNLKESVYINLSTDSFLDDYHNILALLEDLNNRLILTTNDLSQSHRVNSATSIHRQAELSDIETNISSNKEDYYVSIETAFSYGSIGKTDVLGILISLLLKSFMTENKTSTEINGKKQKVSSSFKVKSEEASETQNELKKRMKRFTTNFNKGITSEYYLENIEPDIFIKNTIIYSGFLYEFMEKLGGNFFTIEEIIEECLKITQALTKYTEKNILNTGRKDMRMILIQSLATIYVKEKNLLQIEDDLSKIRYEREHLRSLLTKIHKQIYPLKKNIEVLAVEVIKFLQLNLNINISEVTYQQWFNEFFPLISLDQFEEMIKKEGIIIKKIVSSDMPSILLEKEVKNTADFNLKQLQILNKMLVVEEWENADAFKIFWFNTNRDLPLQRYALHYNLKKKILKKKYVYKDQSREALIEYKENVSKNSLKESLDRGDSSILGINFKKLNDKAK